VNERRARLTVVREACAFGLAGVKNVGEGAIEAILEARAAGPFASVFDFASRIDGRRVNRRVVESLVKCGAFDALHVERAEVWASLDVALEAGAAAQRDREIGQANLFGGADGGVPAPALVGAAPWTPPAAQYEKEVSAYVTDTRCAAVSAQLALRRYAREDTEDATGATCAGGLVTALRETRAASLMSSARSKTRGRFDLVVFAEPTPSTGCSSRRTRRRRRPDARARDGTLERRPAERSCARCTSSSAPRRSRELCVRIGADGTADRPTALRARLAEPGRVRGVHLVIPDAETVLQISSLRGVARRR
jgi:hypothetical protein